MDEIKINTESPKYESLGTLYGKEDDYNLLQFYARNNFLLAINYGITIFNIANCDKECVKFIDLAHDGELIEKISFSLDGNCLVTFSKTMQKTWDLKTWHCVETKNINGLESYALENLKMKKGKTTCLSRGFKATSMGHGTIKLEFVLEKKIIKKQHCQKHHRYSLQY